MLLDSPNVRVLTPVFVTLMRAVRGVYNKCPARANHLSMRHSSSCFRGEYVLSVEVNLAFYVLALTKRHSMRKEEILVGDFQWE